MKPEAGEMTAVREGKPKSRIRRKNEAKILDAAATVFSRRGYEGATVEEIANLAGLSKPNLQYYFRSKEGLYRRLLNEAVEPWKDSLNWLDEDAEPRTALSNYINTKLEYSRRNPVISRVWAQEILSGAPFMKEFLEGELHDIVADKARIMRRWINQGKLRPSTDPYHLIFMIWATTQHYADFSVQACAVLNKDSLAEEDFADIRQAITNIILQGCCLSPEN